jgi:hypothetical protein
MGLSIFNIKKRKKMNPRAVRFFHAMDAVEKVIAENKRQLPAMVRLLMRPVAAEFARHALFHERHHDKVFFELDKFFFNTMRPISQNGCNLWDMPGFRDSPGDPSKQYRLDLTRDVVLPQPWDKEKLTKNVADVGSHGLNGKFLADHNHKVHFLLPFGLAWAEGGNHSIAAGLCDGFGSIVTNEIFDLSVAYPHVTYDGTSFVRKHDGAVLNRPKREEAGLLFEIGRRMLKTGVPYDAPLATPEEYWAQRNSKIVIV